MTARQDSRSRPDKRGRRRPSATRQLRQAGELLFESNPMPAFMTDARDRIIAWNPAAERAFHYDAETVSGRSPRELLAADDADAAWNAIRPELLGGAVWSGILELADATGQRIRVQTTVSPLFDTKQNLTGSIWLHRPRSAVTDADEHNFRALLEMLPMAVFVYQDAKVRYANLAAQRMTGYTRKELQTMEPWTVVHPDYLDIVSEWGKSRERGEPVPDRYEIRFVTKTGEDRWADYSATPVHFDGRPAIMGMAVDITEHKRSLR